MTLFQKPVDYTLEKANIGEKFQNALTGGLESAQRMNLLGAQEQRARQEFGMRQEMMQQKQQELQMQQEQARLMQQDVGNLITDIRENKPITAQRYNELVLKHPQLVEQLAPLKQQMDEQKKQIMISQGAPAYLSLVGGNPEQAVAQFSQLKEAAMNSGDDATAATAESLIQLVRQDPAAAQATLGIVLKDVGGGAVDGLFPQEEDIPASVREFQFAQENPEFDQRQMDLAQARSSKTTVNIGGDDEFQKQASKNRAEYYKEAGERGRKAAASLANIKNIRETIREADTGPVRGRILPSLQPKMVLLESQVLPLIMELRQTGEGSQSDTELRQKLKSAPATTRTEETNTAIMDYFESRALYADILGRIGTAALSGDLPEAEARAMERYVNRMASKTESPDFNAKGELKSRGNIPDFKAISDALDKRLFKTQEEQDPFGLEKIGADIQGKYGVSPEQAQTVEGYY